VDLLIKRGSPNVERHLYDAHIAPKGYMELQPYGLVGLSLTDLAHMKPGQLNAVAKCLYFKAKSAFANQSPEWKTTYFQAVSLELILFGMERNRSANNLMPDASSYVEHLCQMDGYNGFNYKSFFQESPEATLSLENDNTLLLNVTNCLASNRDYKTVIVNRVLNKTHKILTPLPIEFIIEQYEYLVGIKALSYGLWVEFLLRFGQAINDVE
jgi:hypothetical protein